MRLRRILARKLRGNFMRFAFPSKPLSVLMTAVLLAACASSVPSTPQAADEVSPRTEKEIIDAAWMDMDFKRELKTAVQCQDMGILVTTRGYAEGEDVSVTLGVKNGSKDHDVKLHAKVDADGKARVRWPAMGCVDHMPTPLLESLVDKEERPAAVSAGETQAKAKTKAAPRHRQFIARDRRGLKESKKLSTPPLPGDPDYELPAPVTLPAPPLRDSP